MKFLLVLAALAAVAFAELEVFVDDKEIKFDEETLKKLDITEIIIKRGNDEIPALVIPEGKNIIDDQIIALLNKINQQLDQGWPELGIPPLDPFKMDEMSQTFGIPLLFKAKLTQRNIVATGLQSTVIDNINFNLLRMRFDCAFDMPEFTYKSKFTVSGRITLVIPFWFKGNLRMTMSHFRMSGNMALGTTNDGYLTLKTMDLKLNVDKTSLHISSIIGTGPLTMIFNWILNLFTDGIIQNQIESLGDTLSIILFDRINEILGQISLGDLIG